MEVNPLASNPPLPARFNSLGARVPPRKDLSTRSQSQRMQKSGALRDSKVRRSPPGPLGGITDKNAKTKARLSPTANARPLVPAAERRPLGDDAKLGKLKKDSDGDKWDITPDGGSAGREGRQFTVANVGHNGKIYLRYVAHRHERFDPIRRRPVRWRIRRLSTRWTALTFDIDLQSDPLISGILNLILSFP
jgi:hypothetical protein